MVSDDFKKKVKDFFNMVLALLTLLVVSSGTFVGGYMLGLNRVAVPYLNTYIKIPEEKKVVVQPAPGTAPGTWSGAVDPATFFKTSNPIISTELTKYKRFKFSPFNEPRFNFTAVLPADWKATPPKLHLDAGTLMENLDQHKDTQIALAQVDAPGAKMALFQAWALNVPPEVDLDAFYKKYTAALNADILAESPPVGGRKQVLLRYKTDDGQTMLARSVGVRAGDYVMYLNCAGREKEFPAFSDAFNQAALSFSPEQAKGMEPFQVNVVDANGEASVVE